MPQPPIIFYDAECGLCDRCVRFVLRHDHAAVFRFSALGSPTATLLVPAAGQGASAGTFVLVDEDGVFTRSDAALRVASRLSPPWRWLVVLRCVPRPLRDRVYDYIAARRRRWFGAAESCELPNPAWRERFLDDRPS